MSFLISGAKERPKLGHQSLAAQGCLVDSTFPEISDLLVPSSMSLKIVSRHLHPASHWWARHLPWPPSHPMGPWSGCL